MGAVSKILGNDSRKYQYRSNLQTLGNRVEAYIRSVGTDLRLISLAIIYSSKIRLIYKSFSPVVRTFSSEPPTLTFGTLSHSRT